MRIGSIAAMDQHRVIGFKGQIPWHIPQDLQRFKQLTSGHVVLMGRKTFEALPPRFKPLPGRKNVVVSRTLATLDDFEDVDLTGDPVQFLERCRRGEYPVPSGTVWVIGGAEIYRATMPFWDELDLTLVDGEHQGDAFFPEFESGFRLVLNETAVGCTFQRYLAVRPSGARPDS